MEYGYGYNGWQRESPRRAIVASDIASRGQGLLTTPSVPVVVVPYCDLAIFIILFAHKVKHIFRRRHKDNCRPGE